MRLSYLYCTIRRECPLDLKEAISSVCFAAPRCADLPELQQVRILFAGKYGKEFVSSATELMPECGVNRQVAQICPFFAFDFRSLCFIVLLSDPCTVSLKLDIAVNRAVICTSSISGS